MGTEILRANRGKRDQGNGQANQYPKYPVACSPAIHASLTIYQSRTLRKDEAQSSPTCRQRIEKVDMSPARRANLA